LTRAATNGGAAETESGRRFDKRSAARFAFTRARPYARRKGFPRFRLSYNGQN
jgi:hypothetical protein